MGDRRMALLHEPLHQVGLTALSDPADDKRHAVFGFIPFGKLGIDVPVRGRHADYMDKMVCYLSNVHVIIVDNLHSKHLKKVSKKSIAIDYFSIFKKIYIVIDL